MREMLRRAVEAGDIDLFTGMLDAVPDALLRELDADLSLLTFAMAKLSEHHGKSAHSHNIARAMVSTLARFTSYDQFICELAWSVILEESDAQSFFRFQELVISKGPFVIDAQMSEQLITQVYLPNRLFDQIKPWFEKPDAIYSIDTYTLTLLGLVMPDPYDAPTVPRYDALPAFLSGVKKCPNLASALEQVFLVHPPPDHILPKLLSS
jgi:hypothetical protein